MSSLSLFQDEEELIIHNREAEDRARQAAEEKARKEREEQQRLEREREEQRKSEEKERLEREKSERAIRGVVRGVRGTRATARGSSSRGGRSPLFLISQLCLNLLQSFDCWNISRRAKTVIVCCRWFCHTPSISSTNLKCVWWIGFLSPSELAANNANTTLLHPPIYHQPDLQCLLRRKLQWSKYFLVIDLKVVQMWSSG